MYPGWGSYPLPGLRALSFVGIATHWTILQYVLGLPFMTFIALLIYLKTRDADWEKIARTLAKGFVIVFAVGAATGTGSEFGLVLLWPNLTDAAGRYIYFPLYAEIFAFMMEVVFLYMLWYGWDRIPKKALAAVAFLGFLGAWYSASMIVSVNSFMVAPTGIVPAIKVENGHLVYLYDKGYPLITAAIPEPIFKVLNVPLLLKAGVKPVTVNGHIATAEMSINGVQTKVYVVQMPVRIVQQLVREAYFGVKLKDSVLLKPIPQLGNKTMINVAAIVQLAEKNPQALKQLLSELVKITRAEPYVAGLNLAGPIKTNELLAALGNIPVKNILDAILLATIKYVGVTTVTFKSPVFPASIVHVIGSALVVSGFTALAGFSLRLLSLSERASEEYRRYLEKAFVFTAVFAAIAIAFQGFVTGHEMGVAVAHWNPEKFAAMEGTAAGFTSIPKLFHVEGLVEKMMSMVAYGNPNVGIPSYDKIPAHYCQCMLSGQPSFDCRPPLVIHYIYYTKIGLAVLLGLYGLLVGLVALRTRWGLADKLLSALRIRGRPTWVLKLALPFAVLAQIISDMGWAVREIGRKPWTIYGLMTVDVAATTNSVAHMAASLALVALWYIAMITILAVAVYKLLWVPGKKQAAGEA